jgi:hypothetical protein
MPDKDFKLTKKQLFCDGKSIMIINVVDINGAPLDGIVLKITDPYPEKPDEEVTTGDKGPGRAEFLMYGEYWVRVERDGSGKVYGEARSDIAEHVDKVAPAWDLRAAGECEGLTDEECEQRRHTCLGSYELVFQRQW